MSSLIIPQNEHFDHNRSLILSFCLWNTKTLYYIEYKIWFMYLGRDDDKWWVLPAMLLLLKWIQARFLDWHVANLEVSDFSLLCPDPDTFWAYESGA